MFTDWVSAHNVHGVISEFGWPSEQDAPQWNALAELWYRDADAVGLWTFQFVTGPCSYYGGEPYKMLVYRRSGMLWPDGSIDTLGTQASVLEPHSSTEDYRRGIVMAGGDWSDTDAGEPATFSNVNPGTYGLDWPNGWRYENQASYGFIAGRGIDTVRLGFKWERIQPTLYGPLDAVELERIKDSIRFAGNVGIKIVLDLHNYGDYFTAGHVRNSVGGGALPYAAFADLWERLSSEFNDDPNVIAYGLMNEPHDIVGGATRWEQASQAAVDAIRATGDNKLIHVPGYNWSQIQVWMTTHPAPWIVDPADNFLYDAHHYWDRDHSANYRYSYADEVGYAESQGY